MRKAAHHSDGMVSSNPHRWTRGKRLHHHGGGVCWLFVLLWIDLWHHELIVCKKWYKNNLKEGWCGVTFCPTLACTTPWIHWRYYECYWVESSCKVVPHLNGQSEYSQASTSDKLDVDGWIQVCILPTLLAIWWSCGICFQCNSIKIENIFQLPCNDGWPEELHQPHGWGDSFFSTVLWVCWISCPP